MNNGPTTDCCQKAGLRTAVLTIAVVWTSVSVAGNLDRRELQLSTGAVTVEAIDLGGGRLKPVVQIKEHTTSAERAWQHAPARATVGMTTWYVDVNAVGANDGSSWCNAFTRLSEALDNAATGNVATIKVADGTYNPDTTGLSDPRLASFAPFWAVEGSELIGGFPGCGAPDPDAHDPAAFKTILSGDIGVPGDGTDNSYSVLSSIEVTSALLEGFEITGGNADGPLESGTDIGGGAFFAGSPEIREVTFVGNKARRFGGGAYVSPAFDDSAISPLFENCVFRENTAGLGGAIYNLARDAKFTNCRFEANLAQGYLDQSGFHVLGWGGAVVLNPGNIYTGANRTSFRNVEFWGNNAEDGGAIHSGGSPPMANVSLIDNLATRAGGAIFNLGLRQLIADSGSPMLVNCTLVHNGASLFGGGMATYNGSPTLVNCTFTANMAVGGRALTLDATSSLEVANCILRDGGDEVEADSGSTAIITYSNVEGDWPGEGNLDTDPLFVDADGPDDIFGTEDDDLHLREDSPCVDAGDNTSLPGDLLDLDGDLDTSEAIPIDLEGNPRVFDGDGDETATVDMGAHELGERALPAPRTPDPDRWASHVNKNRYLSMVIPTPVVDSDAETAIRVRLTSLHHPAEPAVVPDFGAWEGRYRWVNSLNETHTCPDNVTFGTWIRCAVLGCEPEYRAWGKELGEEVLHVSGASVVPSSQYHVAQLGATCDGNEASCAAVSRELLIATSLHGDVAPIVPGTNPEIWEGLGVLDTARIVDHLKGGPYPSTWPPAAATVMNKPRLQLRPNVPDTLGSYIGVLDVAVCVDAVKGKPYKHFGAFGPCTDCCVGEAVCPYPNALCCDDPLCCEKDEAEDMPPECNP